MVEEAGRGDGGGGDNNMLEVVDSSMTEVVDNNMTEMVKSYMDISMAGVVYSSTLHHPRHIWQQL